MREPSDSKFGLTERDIITLKTIFKKYPEVKSVYIFGSRAKGNYKPGSDIDLAIMNEAVSARTLSNLNSDFSESSLPYTVDLVNFTSLKHPEFIAHIERVGLVFYSQE